MKCTAGAVSVRREEHKRKGGVEMGFNMFIPDIEKTFGRLYYAGPGETVLFSMNGIEVHGRFHLFFAEVKQGEAVEALILWDKKEPAVAFDEAVVLVNPRVVGMNYQTETGGSGDMLLVADGVRSIYDVPMDG